jgi:hypothetical protein
VGNPGEGSATNTSGIRMSFCGSVLEGM